MTDSDNGARDESRQCTSHISIAHDENSNDQAASRDEPCTNLFTFAVLLISGFRLWRDSVVCRSTISESIGKLQTKSSSETSAGIRTSERQSGHSSLSGPRLAGDFVTNCRMQSVQNEC